MSYTPVTYCKCVIHGQITAQGGGVHPYRNPSTELHQRRGTGVSLNHLVLDLLEDETPSGQHFVRKREIMDTSPAAHWQSFPNIIWLFALHAAFAYQGMIVLLYTAPET